MRKLTGTFLDMPKYRKIDIQSDIDNLKAQINSGTFSEDAYDRLEELEKELEDLKSN